MNLSSWKKFWINLRAKLKGEELPPYFFRHDSEWGQSGKPHVNIYVNQIEEYKNWIFLEEDALGLKGQWKTVFEDPAKPMDLEIGCGNGVFFENIVRKNPGRNYLGFEIKYKPLVQTVRRVKRVNAPNGRGVRFHARYIDHILAKGEFENVYIYFPDPWPKTRHEKNRLLRAVFLKKLYDLQKEGGFVDFKTDSESYFDFVCSEIKKTHYKITRLSRDLHQSSWAGENFMTAFEKIFLSKGQPIFYMRLLK